MIEFSKLNLTLDKSIKVIKYKGDDISVKQYLPAEDKIALLEIAMQQADQGTILNSFLLDAIFNTYVVIKYTDIKFTTEELDNILELYDVLESNDIINMVINAIPEEEYKSLANYLEEMVQDYLKYRNSARALLEQFTFFAPTAAEKLQEITENIDPEKLKQIVQIADKTGMNNGQI